MAFNRTVTDQPFIQQGSLSGRWYCITSWRETASGRREALVKHDVTESVEEIIKWGTNAAAR